MERLHDAAAIFRSHPRYTAPERVAAAVTALLTRPGLRLFDHTDDDADPYREHRLTRRPSGRSTVTDP